MHAILSSLTASLLLIHAAFGCCWHHDHACSASAESIHHAADHHQHDSNGNCPDDRCTECQGSCTYDLPQKVRLDGSHAATSFELVATPTAVCNADVQSGMGNRSGRNSRMAAPPTGLHLLHQALLN